MENIKLIGLQVDGLRKLKAVNMKFADKGMTYIKGDNMQGKTSILDAIAIVIGGKKHLNSGALSKDTLTLVGEFSDFKVYREYTKDKNNPENLKSTLKVTGKDGKVLTGNVQLFLDSLINKLSLNPFPFLNKTRPEKLKELMRIFDIDFSDIDNKIKNLEEERVLTSREIKRYGEIEPVDKAEKVDTTDIYKQLEEIRKRNSIKRQSHEDKKLELMREVKQFNEFQELKADLLKKYKMSKDKLSNTKANVINDFNNSDKTENDKLLYEAEITILKKLISTIESEIEKLPKPEEHKVADLFSVKAPVYESENELVEKINNAALINANADRYEVYLNDIKTKEKLQADWQEYTNQINEQKNKKLEILSNVDTKVKGLKITLDDVEFNGIGSENWSDAEGIIISLKLCQAMQPNLKAIFVDRGESIGANMQKALNDWANENDIQAIITQVSDVPENTKDVENCYYIVDGQIV